MATKKFTHTQVVNKKSKINNSKIDALIFIDTNVLLDFYRIRYNDVSMQLLDEIVKHKDLIITTFQVEMEFKKHRQLILGESYGEFIKNRNINFTIPQILRDNEEVNKLNAARNNIFNYQRALEDKFKKTYIDPENSDDVYIKLEEVFRHESQYILENQSELSEQIINLAKRRFDLGSPPRKDKDNSIGDAVNWEWILKCAENSEKSIIIVSRDSDYGRIFDKKPYINDFLAHEFYQKLKGGPKIILTNFLTDAFKYVQIPITDEMVKEEQNIISNKNTVDLINANAMKEALETLQNSLNIRFWQSSDNNTWEDALTKIRNTSLDGPSFDLINYQFPSWQKTINENVNSKSKKQSESEIDSTKDKNNKEKKHRNN
ncbi:PIN domain-containing protein [Chryseobacterium cucumeris]